LCHFSPDSKNSLSKNLPDCQLSVKKVYPEFLFEHLKKNTPIQQRRIGFCGFE